MISEIITDLAIVVGSLEFGGIVGFILLNSKLKRTPKEEANEIEMGGSPYRLNAAPTDLTLPKPKRIEWCWSVRHKAFSCPKCADVENKIQPLYCECDGTEHFHFECRACHFKALMEPYNGKHQS